jgi:hypothetical protein
VIHETDDDRAAEARIAAKLADVWECEFTHYPQCHYVDYYAYRDRRLLGYVELKRRNRAADYQPHVYIDVTKWADLVRLAEGEHPALYVVVFTVDRVCKWIDARDVNTSAHIRVGRRDRGEIGVHPAIELPVADMRDVDDRPW